MRLLRRKKLLLAMTVCKCHCEERPFATKQSQRTHYVLMPGGWTVQQGHDWSEQIEADVRRVVPHAHVTTHLEPKEDPVSWIDQELDRPAD